MMQISIAKVFQAVLVLVVSLLLSACGEKEIAQPQFATVDITGAPWGTDFQLNDHHGQARSLANFRGKAVVLFFGYLNCPDVCPTAMAKLAAAMQALGEDANRVQVLLITLDPKRDTPEILKQYVPAFHPAFLGLRGDEYVTSNLAKDFKLVYQLQKPNADGFYTIDHSGGIYVFDPHGRIRLFIGDEHSPDVIARDLRILLKQSDGLRG